MANNKPKCEICGFELTEEESKDPLNEVVLWCKVCIKIERVIEVFEKALNCRAREGTIVEVDFKVKKYTDYNI